MDEQYENNCQGSPPKTTKKKKPKKGERFSFKIKRERDRKYNPHYNCECLNTSLYQIIFRN